VPAPAPRELLLDLTSLFLLGCNLIFFQQWDAYQLPFLPLVAIVLAKRYEGLMISRRLVVAGCCLLLLVGSAIWTREDLAKDEVQWVLAKRLRESGVQPQNIASSWEWFAYWSFPHFVRQEGKTGRDGDPQLFGRRRLAGAKPKGSRILDRARPASSGRIRRDVDGRGRGGLLQRLRAGPRTVLRHPTVASPGSRVAALSRAGL